MKAGAITTVSLMALAIAITATGVRADRVLSIEPDSLLVHPTDLFTLDLTVNAEIDSLMGYNVTIRFDATYLQVVDVTEGALPPSSGFDAFFRWLNEECACDSIHVNGSILGNTVSGPGVISRIEFRAIKAGVTYVEIARSDIRNGENGRLTHGRAGAKVTIEAPIGTADCSWGQIKHRYR
jgi:hypothetical protein